MFVLAPETPDEIVQTWRRVFREVTEDAEFKADAASLSREVNYGDPEILKADIEKAKDFSSGACQLFADLYGVPQESRNLLAQTRGRACGPAPLSWSAPPWSTGSLSSSASSCWPYSYGAMR